MVQSIKIANLFEAFCRTYFLGALPLDRSKNIAIGNLCVAQPLAKVLPPSAIRAFWLRLLVKAFKAFWLRHFG